MKASDWVWLILLLVVINAAGFMLLRTYWDVTDTA